MQPLRAGADRTKCATVRSRCSRVARQHRLGDKALESRLWRVERSEPVKGCSVPIGEGSDGGGK
jgi:hypothetical protein